MGSKHILKCAYAFRLLCAPIRIPREWAPWWRLREARMLRRVVFGKLTLEEPSIDTNRSEWERLEHGTVWQRLHCQTSHVWKGISWLQHYVIILSHARGQWSFCIRHPTTVDQRDHHMNAGSPGVPCIPTASRGNDVILECPHRQKGMDRNMNQCSESCPIHHVPTPHMDPQIRHSSPHRPTVTCLSVTASVG